VNFSIVIPVFRNELTIERALMSIEHSAASIDHPSAPNVVVVIDGIVDGSLDIVQTWQRSTNIPHQVITQNNAGIAAARNVGWRSASTGSHFSTPTTR
jgi:glycosyltransferase involved in cell wall biosynthesis